MSPRIKSDFVLGSILPASNRAPCTFLGEGARREKQGERPAIFNSELNTWLDVPSSAHNNADAYLARKIRESKTPVNIVDIGIGSGQQWINFAQRHGFEIGKHFNIYGNVLYKGQVIPALRGVVKTCPASKLHTFFESSSMDFVVSHSGMHGEALAGLENAIHLTKPGGEIIISAHEFNASDIDFENPHYTIIGKKEHEEHPSMIYGLHLRKK